jgi:hypothetical protein
METFCSSDPSAGTDLLSKSDTDVDARVNIKENRSQVLTKRQIVEEKKWVDDGVRTRDP